MASPLAAFANARICWTAQGTRSSGRDGFVVTAGQSYLITAFLKRRNLPSLLDDRLNLPAINGTEVEFTGYTISYAPIDAAEVDTFSTMDISGLAFNNTALLPPGVHLNDRARVFIQGLGVVEVRIADKAGKFGELGIGEITRGVLGDPLYLIGGMVG